MLARCFHTERQVAFSAPRVLLKLTPDNIRQLGGTDGSFQKEFKSHLDLVTHKVVVLDTNVPLCGYISKTSAFAMMK
jgi:hypothetical protein